MPNLALNRLSGIVLGAALMVLGVTSMPLLPWAGGVVAVAGAVLLALSRRGFNPIRRFVPEAPIFTT